MEKEKLKRGLIFLCCIVVVGGAFFWIESQRGKKTDAIEPTTSESSIEKSTEQVTSQSDSSSEETRGQESSEESSTEEQNKIKDFGKRMVNYETVYKRNQSIKQFLTMKCIEENTINVDPHVDKKATGEVISVAADLVDQHTYIVIAEEKVNNSSNQLMITVHYNKQLKKIDQYEIDYIRNGNQ